MDKLLEEMMEKTGEGKDRAEPNKWGFIGEQLLLAAKEHYVGDPSDIAYQLSRKIAGEVIESKYDLGNELVKEGVAIGIYKGLEMLLGKLSRFAFKFAIPKFLYPVSAQ